MADTVPDRPSLPVTVRTPATDCQSAAVSYCSTGTPSTKRRNALVPSCWTASFGTSPVVPSGWRPRWQVVRTGVDKGAIEFDVEEERVRALAGQSDYRLEDMARHRTRGTRIRNRAGAFVERAGQLKLMQRAVQRCRRRTRRRPDGFESVERHGDRCRSESTRRRQRPPPSRRARPRPKRRAETPPRSPLSRAVPVIAEREYPQFTGRKVALTGLGRVRRVFDVDTVDLGRCRLADFRRTCGGRAPWRGCTRR